MLFTSWSFAAFIAIVFCIYYWPPFQKFQVWVLVAASIAFYAIDQTRMVPLLLVAVIGTYLCLALTPQLVFLPVGIVFNLILLGFFKYKFLFIGSTRAATGFFWLDLLLALPLPIGISFFVFHNISLLVDHSKGQAGKRPKLIDVFLYIIFFPQLVSGPIARAALFLPQIEVKLIYDVPFVSAGRWIIAGYFFKLFAADNLNQLTTFMTTPASLGSFDRCLLVFIYSFQIYSDFFGYSAIAIGLAMLFGYRLPINFLLPYTSASFSEFWTRWHISLSTWLRTYLYIPLGGNRRGEARTYLNLMIVMSLGGLWHGAALSYLIWGTVHGLLLVAERPLLSKEQRLYAAGFAVSSVIRALRIIITFVCVSFAWTFFKLPDFSQAAGYLYGIFDKPFNPTQSQAFYWLCAAYSLPAILQHLASKLTATKFYVRIEPFLYGAMIYLSLTEAGPNSPFIYFQF